MCNWRTTDWVEIVFSLKAIGLSLEENTLGTIGTYNSSSDT